MARPPNSVRARSESALTSRARWAGPAPGKVRGLSAKALAEALYGLTSPPTSSPLPRRRAPCRPSAVQSPSGPCGVARHDAVQPARRGSARPSKRRSR
jgi:hypothetical protein